MKSKLAFWIIWAASAVLFFSPLAVEERVGLGLDKIVHIVLFAALVILGLLTYQKYKIQVIVLLFFYTVTTELIQKHYIPHRNFDAFDILSDSIGIVFGILIYRFWIRSRMTKAEK